MLSPRAATSAWRFIAVFSASEVGPIHEVTQKPAALCDDVKASAGGARGGAQDAYFAPSALAGFALIEACTTGARTAGSELSIDHGLRATNRTPKKEPAKRVARSAGFAIRSPRGMGDPHDNAPRGSQHLSSVATCSHGEPAP